MERGEYNNQIHKSLSHSLSDAIERGHIDIIKYLLDFGIIPEERMYDTFNYQLLKILLRYACPERITGWNSEEHVNNFYNMLNKILLEIATETSEVVSEYTGQDITGIIIEYLFREI